MKTLNIKQVGSGLLLVGILAGCNSSQAPEAATTSPASEPSASAAPAKTPAAEVGDVSTPTAIPDSADAIWQSIDGKSAELKASIQSGALKDVHHQAFAIRDLVAALPAHSPALPADDLEKLQGQVKFVAMLADRLDETGDSGDQAGAQANYEKLVAVLNSITRTK